MRTKKALFKQMSMIVLMLIFTQAVIAQKGVISGIVKDKNGQTLAGATIQAGSATTTSDKNGVYSLTVNVGKQKVSITYVGRLKQEYNVVVTENTTVRQDLILEEYIETMEVTVVGSRSLSRTKTETAVPVDIIPIAEVVNAVGQVDINQILTYIAPSFQSSKQTIADGTDHVDPAQLRGLGTDQVLVLLNGKRRHQSALVNVNGTVNRGSVGTDMSAIPATAVERIEILRDGAAAQYGSDAIAGVINIVLKKKTGVLEATSSFGQYNTEYEKHYAYNRQFGNKSFSPVKVSDGSNFQAAIGYGFKMNKGSLMVTGELIQRDPTNRTGTYTGTIFPNVSGQNRDDSIMMARSLNRNSFDMMIGNSKMRSTALFYNFNYAINANTEFYMFGGYSNKKGTSAGFYRYPTSIVSNAKNYANNVFSIFPNGFLPQINSEILDFSTAIGIKTKFKGWNVDFSNTYGMNRFNFIIDNSLNYTQFANAGNKQTSFDAGGLKFYQNTINADLTRKFDVLSGLNVAAGAEYRLEGFAVKSGEEASYKNYDVPSTAAAGAQVFAGFVSPNGGATNTRNSTALYVDLEQDFSKMFLLTGALRYENYSDFGSTFNYKFAGRIRFSEDFNIRGSISTGFRAPSMQQKFYAKTNTLFVSNGSTLVPVEAGTFTNDSKVAEILGIPRLKQETSKNYSIGFTAKPFKGFVVTVDAYQIDIDNRIVLTNNFTGGNNTQLQQQLSAAGANTANVFTNAIDTRATGIEAVFSYKKVLKEGQTLTTTLALTHIKNTVKKDADGKTIIHASNVLVNSGQLGNYFNREDQSRIEVANPQNKSSLTIEYKVNKFTTMLRFTNFGWVSYLDPSINPLNPSAFPVNSFTGVRETLDQDFAPKTVTDLSLSYQMSKNLTATIGANNLFDIYQDKHSHSGNMSSGRFIFSRRVQQMGFNGAYYFARLRFSLNTN
ncbi:MAG: TonB-dependent receptor [Chitinophagaceae bacterium]|nr:TonB-dependent receptor [Chitinophagaceae bacterium]